MKCERINCICTHTEGCDRGFIFTRYKDVKELNVNGEKKTIETWYDGVLFCPTCYPERAFIQRTSATSEEMQHRLRERSHLKATENYEKSEERKTNVL